MDIRAAGLIAFITAWSILAAPSFGGHPAHALDTLEIRDVDNSPVPSKEGRLICRVEARNDDDRQFLKRLWEGYGRIFGFKDWNNFGPDSLYRQVRLVYDAKVLTLKSWHPIYERNQRVVVTSKGVMSLEKKRSRADVLRKDNPAYLARRAAFDGLLERCLGHRQRHAKP